jgi:hypothetical protein
LPDWPGKNFLARQKFLGPARDPPEKKFSDLARPGCPAISKTATLIFIFLISSQWS